MRRLRPDAGARPGGAERQVADGQRDQVRRHGRVQPKAEGAAALRRLPPRREHVGAHHRRQLGGDGDAGVVALADAGRVLRGDPRPREDGLPLREEERVPLPRRLLRREPLQRAGVRTRPVADDDPPRLGQPHDERPAQHGVRRAELPRQRLTGGVRHPLDVQAARVEDDLVGAGGGLHVQRGRALQRLAWRSRRAGPG